MPKGIYQKTRLYSNTYKLTEALGALKYHDPDFTPAPNMTNDDIFAQLKSIGFRYRDGRWRATFSNQNTNGHIGTNMLPEHEVIVTPIGGDHLEMCLGEDQLETVQGVIDAMHTLGFKVDVKITGTK